MKHSKLEIALLTISVVFVVVMLIVPLVSVLVNSLAEGWDFYIQALTTPYVLSALRLTLIATVVAVIVNTIFGLGAAWAISKFDFKGKHFLTTLIDIPFSISPVIAGLAFIMTFGRMGWIGQWIEVLNDYWGTDIQIVFAIPGVILATIFVTFPFVFREIIPVLSTNGRDEEEAAALMGASAGRFSSASPCRRLNGPCSTASSSVRPGPSVNLAPSAPCRNCAARPLRCLWKSTPCINRGQPMPLQRPLPHPRC